MSAAPRAPAPQLRRQLPAGLHPGLRPASPAGESAAFTASHGRTRARAGPPPALVTVRAPGPAQFGPGRLDRRAVGGWSSQSAAGTMIMMVTVTVTPHLRGTSKASQDRGVDAGDHSTTVASPMDRARSLTGPDS